ncbi:MAG TPA: hypothetical protein VMA36_07450 [Candidatus Limnocylindria bacterium]|nr:hypothetical protein [Candidatus Limnocylindria bacterium]
MTGRDSHHAERNRQSDIPMSLRLAAAERQFRRLPPPSASQVADRAPAPYIPGNETMELD